MAFFKSKAVQEYRPSINACQAGDVRVVPFSFTASVALAINDVVGLAKLPAQHIPVDCFVAVPDLDTGSTLVISAGFYTDNDLGDTTIDATSMIDSSSFGQAGGIERMTEVSGISTPPLDVDQIFALTIDTGPAGGGVSATPITGWLSYRPVSYDD